MRQDQASHQAACFLGVETDDLVLAVLQVLELGVDDACVQRLALDRAEVFVGRQVEQYVVALGLQRFVQPAADAFAPEGIEVLASAIDQLGAHFQAIGLHQVQWPQHAIQAGQHAQVGLGEIEVLLGEVFGIQAGVDVTLERQQRLLGVGGVERAFPAAEACGVETGELVRQAHQLGDLGRAELAQLGDQFLGVVEVLGLGEARGGGWRLVIEGLGR